MHPIERLRLVARAGADGRSSLLAREAATALVARGDLRSRVVDVLGDGGALVRRLTAAGSDSALVPESGVGAAVATSDLVLLDAVAMGDDGLVAVTGARAAAAVARHAGVAVWAVAGLGSVLP